MIAPLIDAFHSLMQLLSDYWPASFALGTFALLLQTYLLYQLLHLQRCKKELQKELHLLHAAKKSPSLDTLERMSHSGSTTLFKAKIGYRFLAATLLLAALSLFHPEGASTASSALNTLLGNDFATGVVSQESSNWLISPESILNKASSFLIGLLLALFAIETVLIYRWRSEIVACKKEEMAPSCCPHIGEDSLESLSDQHFDLTPERLHHRSPLTKEHPRDLHGSKFATEGTDSRLNKGKSVAQATIENLPPGSTFDIKG